MVVNYGAKQIIAKGTVRIFEGKKNVVARPDNNHASFGGCPYHSGPEQRAVAVHIRTILSYPLKL